MAPMAYVSPMLRSCAQTCAESLIFLFHFDEPLSCKRRDRYRRYTNISERQNSYIPSLPSQDRNNPPRRALLPLPGIAPHIRVGIACACHSPSHAQTLEKPNRLGPVATYQIDFAIVQAQIASVLDGYDYLRLGLAFIFLIFWGRENITGSPDAFAGLAKAIFPLLGLPKTHTGKAMAEVPFCCIIECATGRCERCHVTAIGVRCSC